MSVHNNSSNIRFPVMSIAHLSLYADRWRTHGRAQRARRGCQFEAIGRCHFWDSQSLALVCFRYANCSEYAGSRHGSRQHQRSAALTELIRSMLKKRYACLPLPDKRHTI